MTSVIWDFDGTIANSYPGMVLAVQQSLKNNFDIELSKDTIFKDIKKTSIRSYVTELFENNSVNNNDVATNVKIFYHDYKYFEAQYQDKIVLIPHVLVALSALKDRGVRQFIVTHRDKSIYDLTKTLGIDNYFDEVVSVEDDHVRKPDPNMINYLTDKYRIDTNDLWVIGDRQIDIDFGNSVKAKTILLSDSHPDFGQTDTISDLSEISKIIK